jgi:hypothetical protein
MVIYENAQKVFSLAIFFVFLFATTPLNAVAQANSTEETVIITGVQAEGNESLTHEFVELYNPSAIPVDIYGWKVRYASAHKSRHRLLD